MALAAQPGGFTASELGQKLRQMHGPDASGYTVRQALYDLRKLRAKGFVRRIEGRRRYELATVGSRALIAPSRGASLSTGGHPKRSMADF